MRICLCTPFYPTLGGVTTFSAVVAREWVIAGHDVTLITDVECDPRVLQTLSFPCVSRRQTVAVYRAAMRCDVFVQNNVSVRALWPLLGGLGKYVVIHHGYYHSSAEAPRLLEGLKLSIARRLAFNTFVSEAVRDHVGTYGPVMANPYDDSRFRLLGHDRDIDVAFVGRLVSQKGATVLIDALAEMHRNGMRPTVAIVGDGPERRVLEEQVKGLRLSQTVNFLGRRSHDELPHILNRTKIMAVPSLVQEGLPIAVLEGIACGCVVVGSIAGGLPEAIGPCGEVFPMGDPKTCARILTEMLERPQALEGYRSQALRHIDRNRSQAVARNYIQYFNALLDGAS